MKKEENKMYVVDGNGNGNWCVECTPIGEVYKNHAEVKAKRELERKAKRERAKAYLYKATLVAAGALGACLCIYGATL